MNYRKKALPLLILFAVMLLCGCGLIAESPEDDRGDEYGNQNVSKTASPTPGTGDPVIDPGTEEDKIDWSLMPLTGLAFSEAMSSNSKYAEHNGSFCDWIELVNNSDSPIDMSLYWISDNKDIPQKLQLPAKTLAPGERYMLYCNSGTGEDEAPFKISSSGEKIYLSNADGFCDRIKVPDDVPKDTSYGRLNGQWVYFDAPSPGNENGSGYEKQTLVPISDYATGIYKDPINVTLSGEGTVYYTTDGSKPTTSSKVYSGAISVTGVTTIRAISVENGRESAESVYTYVIGKNHELPVLVVSGPYDKVLGPNGVVQLNTKNKGIEAEVMMTLIEDGEERFSAPCGISLSGNNGGSRDADKRNFNVHFRSAYGLSKLKYKLFDDLEIDTFNSIRLKGGGEDWNSAIIRDEFMTHMVIGNTALSAQASKPVVMYLGGEYWGIYFIRERFSTDYVASHFDVSKESVHLLQGYNEGIEAGSREDYDELYTFAKNNDLSKAENYDYLASRIDLDSFMDWYICRSYMGDKDPGGNIRFFRSTEGDNKWRWMFYDLDWGFYHKDDDPLTWQLESKNVKDKKTVIMFRKIVKSPQGKDAFLKRYAHLMDTILNEEYITKELDHWKEILASEIEADRARWGKSLSGWNSAMDKLYDYVKDGKRDANVLRDLKSYFGLSDEQMKSYFGDKYKK